ncbi:alkylation response protein AidB-like acyl-CoA dehydrogenase [Kibdelosporangium banguiense]|uniref:Alkylation response protein AidB-like acyl-CoA dehydrogenase n=1 Tax=Kibdelosporangium banguiense TaxID=1365924 RepID=A0ABS4TTM1_9PSEU|nr:acyl-CoA dehydrogenase family protein [Kibdelosporangium banguiense]MBP2327757.1 alkylation response protein AidB-like acyl-CoA dehydrogenase [Kibdelosporangium banguiense]
MTLNTVAPSDDTQQPTLRAEAVAAASRFAPRARELRQHVIDHHEIHPELWSELCDRGWPGLLRSDGLAGMSLVLEAFAEQGILLWLPVLSSAVAHAIDKQGPDPARRWLEGVSAGTTLLGVAMTEPETGHNVFATRTQIRRDGDTFVVNGFKQVTSGLDIVDRVLVHGRAVGQDGTSSGYATVLVDPRAAGATATEVPMGNREGLRQFGLELRDVVVPAADLVGDVGSGMLVLWSFANVERVLTASICLGAARHCIEAAVDRARTRTIAGGLPIGTKQAISHPIARLHARYSAARSLLLDITAAFDAGDDGASFASNVNAVKVLASELAFDAADHTVQVFGAEAWDRRGPWMDLYLDARLSRSGPLSNEFALNFLAEHVLGLPAN